MKALLFLVRRMIVNWVKELKRHPGAAIFYVLLLGFISFSVIMGSFSSQDTNQELADPRFLNLIVLAIYLLVAVFTIRSGMQSGQTLFKLSDVNFVFTSPISSNKILFYGLLKQMGTSLFAAFFLLYQIPNLRNAFGVGIRAILVLCLSYCVMLFTLQIASMFVYSACVNHPRTATVIKGVALLAAAVIAVWVGGTFLRTRDIMLTLNLTLFQPWMDYVIPLAGWGTAFGMMLITGEFIKGGISICLLLAANGACIYYIIRCNADYYEDVLGVTEQAFTKTQAAKEGRIVNQKKKPMKLKETGIGKGWGANVIYQRHRLEQRRKGKGLVDMKTLGLTALVGFVAYLSKDSDMGLFSAFLSSTFLLFFTSAMGPFNMELMKPYIFLIPEPPFRKVLYGIGTDIQKSLIDGVLAFGIGALLIAGSPFDAIACILSFVAVNLLFLGVNLLVDKILAGKGGTVMQLFFYFLFLALLQAPGIVVGILVGIATQLYMVGILAFGLISGGLGFLILYLCRYVLHNMEIASPHA